MPAALSELTVVLLRIEKEGEEKGACCCDFFPPKKAESCSGSLMIVYLPLPPTSASSLLCLAVHSFSVRDPRCPLRCTLATTASFASTAEEGALSFPAGLLSPCCFLCSSSCLFSVFFLCFSLSLLPSPLHRPHTLPCPPSPYTTLLLLHSRSCALPSWLLTATDS